MRFHTAEPLTHPPLLALKPASGQAFSALAASLPLGNRAVELALSPRPLDGRDALQVPVGPSGFLLGMTVTGVPLLGQFTDAVRFTRVGIHADDEVVVQLVLRAAATGATVLVHTDRPQVWEPVCGDRITLAGAEKTRIPTIVVYDGEDTQSPVISGGERGHAAVALGATPPANADVVITQTSREQIGFSTPDLANVKLTIMRPRNEAQFLAHLRRPAAETPAGRRLFGGHDRF